MSLKNIIVGHVKELTNDNDELHEKRMAICRACPLFILTAVGPMCNHNRYYDEDTDETYATQNDEESRIRGCGCRLNAKTRLEDAICPRKLW